MYIAVTTMGKKACGETLVMKRDALFDTVGVYEIDGSLVGYVASDAPDGCLKLDFIEHNIGVTRIICTSAVAFENMLIVSTDSPTLAGGRYEYIERGGYSSLVPVAQI